MTDIPFYTKFELVELMQKKRGAHYTLGWLKMAYAMPPVDEAVEVDLVQREMKTLLVLPDYDGV